MGWLTGSGRAILEEAGRISKFVAYVAISLANASRISFTAFGASRWHQWAAPSTTAVRASGIASAIAWAKFGGVTGSCSPQQANAGQATRSGSLIRPIAVAAD